MAPTTIRGNPPRTWRIWPRKLTVSMPGFLIVPRLPTNASLAECSLLGSIQSITFNGSREFAIWGGDVLSGIAKSESRWRCLEIFGDGWRYLAMVAEATLGDR